MMYKQLREAIMICYHCGITPFVWGDTGLGKSENVFDLAMLNDFGFIDMRLSQIESTDLRGLPDKENGHTIYLPPIDLPVGGLADADYHKLLAAETTQYGKMKAARANQRRRNKGFLFLDELPRAQDDVQQACFQLVLDGAIGPNYVLPPGWLVICAGNYLEGAYQQSGFTDPAFISRFCHLELSRGKDTVEEWVDYMAAAFGKEAIDVTQFACMNMNHLDGAPRGKTDLGFTIQPSRRAWKTVHKILQFCKTTEIKHEQASKWAVIGGLVGFDLAQSYKDHVCPVRPLDILEKGVEANLAALAKIANDRPALSGVMWGLVSLVKPTIHEDKCAEVALDFVDWMCDSVKESDLIIAFCFCLTGKGDGNETEYLRNSVLSNHKAARLLLNAKKIAPNTKISFLERMVQRPELQAKLELRSWGKARAARGL